jgi:hypothetical protein
LLVKKSSGMGNCSGVRQEKMFKKRNCTPENEGDNKIGVEEKAPQSREERAAILHVLVRENPGAFVELYLDLEERLIAVMAISSGRSGGRSSNCRRSGYAENPFSAPETIRKRRGRKAKPSRGPGQCADGSSGWVFYGIRVGFWGWSTGLRPRLRGGFWDFRGLGRNSGLIFGGKCPDFPAL